MNRFSILKIFGTLTSSLFFTIPLATANNITIQQVTSDIEFLANDNLKGRAAFTSEIDDAADYIANRFSKIGLKPFKGLKSFKQEFEIFQITPASILVRLDSQVIPEEQLMSLTSHQTINWNNLNEFKVLYVTIEDNFRDVMNKINQQHENILVIVHPEHAGIFGRYRNHFTRGLTKFEKNTGASAVVAITPLTDIKEFSIVVKSEIKTQTLTNVVGVLWGKNKTDEQIIYSAHYDHLGTNSKSETDLIFNGADDDASGTSAVINLASYFATKNDNLRTLVFVAFTAEEIGGYGSQYFSKQIHSEQVKAMINIEMIGKPSVFGAGKLWMTGYERSDLATIMNNSLNDNGLIDQKIQKDPYPEQQLFYRSDNATLARLGVPAHSFSSSQIDKDVHYHQVSDDLASLDISSMTQVINTIAIASESLINGKKSPTRLDTSQIEPKGTIF